MDRGCGGGEGRERFLQSPDSAIKSQQGPQSAAPCFIPGKRRLDRSAAPCTLSPLGHRLPEPLGHPSMLEFALQPPHTRQGCEHHAGPFCKLADISWPDPKLLTVTQQIPVDSKQAWARPFGRCDSLKTLQYHPDAFCTPLLQHQVPFHTAAVSS